MEIGIKLLIIVGVYFSLLTSILFIAEDKANKKELFDVVRATNQMSLVYIKDNINDMEVITSEYMLEKWLETFVNYDKGEFDNLDIEFLYLNSNPPVYVVAVEGYEKYAYISSDLYAYLVSATTIVVQ